MHKERSSKGDFVSIGSIIPNLLGKGSFYKISYNWECIVGCKLAELCRPCKVADDEGILYLNIERGGALEVQHSLHEILQKVNDYLASSGSNKIKQIKILQKRYG